MKCVNCGKDNRPGAAFCQFCGRPLVFQTAADSSRETSTSPKIFLTHSWKDIESARRLYRDLMAKGFRVWFDDQAVQAGHRMAEEIDRGLAWCDVYIPVLSGASLSSPWCQEEINAALTLSNDPARGGHPRIIPVLVENCQDQMSPMLKARLYINFTGRYEEAFQELLAKGFGSPGTIPSPPHDVSPQIQPSIQKVTRPASPGLSARVKGAIIVVWLFILLLLCGVAFFTLYQLIAMPTPSSTAIALIPTASSVPSTIPTLPIPTILPPPSTPVPTILPPSSTPVPPSTPIIPSPTPITPSPTVTIPPSPIPTNTSIPTRTPTPPNPVYSLGAKRYPSLCLGVQGNSQAEGALIEQRTCSGNANQLWELQSMGGGYYQLVSKSSGKCMAVKDGSTQVWAMVVQATCRVADYQIWYLRQYGGYYQLAAKHSGQCVDEDAFSSKQGLEMHQGPCGTSDIDNQLWQLK